MKQYLFYQHNVQRFFLRHREKFSGVIAPLSIVATFPDGTQGFLRALFADDPQKEFIIDPRSPLFQKSWDRTNIRPPHKRMAAVFGVPFTTKGLRSKVESTDFAGEILKTVTESCIEFQKQFPLRPQERKKVAKYARLLGVDTLPKIENPQLCVPPYFEFAQIGDPWHRASMDCIKYATTTVPLDRVRPVIHFSSIDAIAEWQTTISVLASSGVTSAFIYPNNFREHEVSKISLARLSKAISEFSQAGISPYALHGGYFSIALSKRGLDGFGNGVGYGEWRDSGYHRGGTAEKRIYIPKLHRFLDSARAQFLLDRNPEYFSSDADLLAECIDSHRPLETVSLEEALDHFLECRAYEMNFVSRFDPVAIKRELTETTELLGKLGVVEQSYAESLIKWTDIIGTW